MNYSPQVAPKKQGGSTGKILLVAGGVLLLMCFSTCGVLAFQGYSKYKTLASELAEGGVPDASPPAVRAELGGAKKDYLGEWTSPSGKSELRILPSGELRFHKHETTLEERFEGVIASFKGDDIEVDAMLHFMLKVRTPPHRVGDKFEIVVNDVTLERPATP